VLTTTQAALKTDGELVDTPWQWKAINRPWTGLALGDSGLKVFSVEDKARVDDLSLRQKLSQGRKGGTTWKPVFEKEGLQSAASGTPVVYAEFLVYASSVREEQTVVLPYVLRLRYDDASGRWYRETLWTPGSGAPRLIF